jgi:alpha-beta hydrolase superfamily lysophospholipase
MARTSQGEFQKHASPDDKHRARVGRASRDYEHRGGPDDIRTDGKSAVQYAYETTHAQRSKAAPHGQRVERHAIITADGTELAAEVHAPPSRDTRGAVVFVHGFCGDKGENGLFHALATRCVATGFAAVLYDWRGLADSEGDFPSSTLNDHTSDFEQVAQWTKARFGARSKSLHAVGFSLGAAVIGLALRQQLKLTSVAYLSPAARPVQSMWPRYSGEQLWSELAIHGVVKKPGSSVLLGRAILESLRDTDLGPRAFDLKVPLLVCHGTGDVRIDCSHTRKLVDTREPGARPKSDPDFRYIEFDGASHSFRPAETCWDKLGDELAAWFA